jgi:hypothetical protein
MTTLTAADLFAGLGGNTLGATRAGLRVVCAANHNPEAVRYHKANHPDVEHYVQDLQQADFTRWPDFDVLLASPCCVPGDAQVCFADGRSVRADQVKEGDVVLTHRGRGRPIVNIWTKQYSGKMVSLVAWGDTKAAVTMTADHLVWVSRRRWSGGPLGQPEFVRADEVREGDYVAFPETPSYLPGPRSFVETCRPARVHYLSPETTVPTYARGDGKVVAEHARAGYEGHMPGAKVVLDGESLSLWWLVGHYLGDGLARDDRPQVGWCVGGSVENRNRVIEILGSLGLRYWMAGRPGNETVHTSSRHLHAICMRFGRLCHVKSIPPEVLRFPVRMLAALMEGYLAADGSERRQTGNPTDRATSTSLSLLQGLQRIAWKLGWSAGIAVGGKARDGIIEGRRVRCRDTWELILIRQPHKQSRTKFAGGMIWRSLRSVQTTEVVDLKVYDFEVAEDHTFCLPGVVVHNCQGFSRARGRDRPHHDNSRSTAWAVVGCVEAKRPPFLMVENVEDFARWTLFPQWRSCLEALGYVLCLNVLDAADFGVPQERVRLYVTGVRRDVSTRPVAVQPPGVDRVAAATLIEWDKGSWGPLDRKLDGTPLAPATVRRLENGRREFGERFLAPYYGSGSGKRGGAWGGRSGR